LLAGPPTVQFLQFAKTEKVYNALSLVMSLSALNHPWCLKKLAVFNAALQALQPSTLGWKLQEGISRSSEGTSL